MPQVFSGRAVCRRLVQEGAHVRGITRKDDIAQGLPDGMEVVQIPSLGRNNACRIAMTDVDTVIHLAARVHITRESADDPLKEFRMANVAVTDDLARMSVETGVKRFIFISSIKVNGEGRNGSPYNEWDEPMPEDPYSLSKWEAEQALHVVAQKTKLQIVILRPPMVYGPAVKANFLQLMKIVNRGIPLPFASVQNKRSMIYLENIVDAIITCISHPKAPGQTFLLSDSEDVSTPELIRRLAVAFGKEARLLPIPLWMLRMTGRLTFKSADIERLLGSLTIDTTTIQHELAWKPPYTMEQGLKKTAEWFLKDSVKH